MPIHNRRYARPLGLLFLTALLALTQAQAATVVKPSQGFINALGGDGVITVEINKGTPVHLATAAASVAIADPAIADVQIISPKLILVAGRGVGETSLIVTDAQENVILQSTVDVTHNLSRFSRAVKEMIPDSKVTVASADNAIVLKGKVDSPVMAEKVQRLASGFLSGNNQHVISMLDTSDSDQVMLKVRVVELARSELKRFGINWESIISNGSFVFGLGQGRDFVGNTLTAAGTANTFDRSTAGDNSIFAGARTNRLNINTVIDALETDGLVSVLAEPNLTTRSGEKASFLAGGEIPIPVQGQNQQVTIEYHQFGVSLQFQPVVLSKDKISLTVLPEVSAISEDNGVTTATGNLLARAFTTRRASTTVDMGSGQTFAIAGLLRNDTSNQISKYPFLGDIPVLGTLFRSNAFQNNQTELVILVTPYIVRPVDDPNTLTTPVDGLKRPSDFDRIILGRISGAPDDEAPDSRAKTTPSSVFSGAGGQAGFLLR